MPVPPVSPYNMVMPPQELNPRMQSENHAVTVALGHTMHKAVDKGKSDSVVISRKAVNRAQHPEEAAEEAQEHHDDRERIERLPDGTYHPRGR